MQEMGRNEFNTIRNDENLIIVLDPIELDF